HPPPEVEQHPLHPGPEGHGGSGWGRGHRGPGSRLPRTRRCWIPRPRTRRWARRTLTRGKWGPFWEGNRAAGNATAVVHNPGARHGAGPWPGAGGHHGELEAAKAAGEGAAPRRGQELDP